MRGARGLAAVGAGLVVATLLTACDDINTIGRADEHVVLTGADLPALVGADPGRIVAFAHHRTDDTPGWTQVPVQVDQRKVVGFGAQPANNNTAGTEGTVYGNGAPGVTALQYADPTTWVGPDGNPAFDADDELVFMVADAGGLPRAGEETEPAGVVPGSGVKVQLDDPLGADQQGWLFLFRSDGTLDPAAGRDYVDYDFTLTSGAYRTTYKRADGPNPETSRALTEHYEIGFGDRWIEDRWRVLSGSATGVDVLDGVKNQFALSTCGRSNATFADAEGAFVANIDGPVRAIRSYVGANSGPLTQRTHFLYRQREEIVTDLRVHAIPAVMDYVDLSAAATGMTYASSLTPAPVPVDGVVDTLPTGYPTWERYTGAQGSILTAVRFDTTVPFASGLAGAVTWFTRDQSAPPETQCWGDTSFYGAAGPWVTEGIANTDPRTSPWYLLQTRRTVQFGPPGVDDTISAAWATQLDTPLAVTVSGYAPA